MEIDKELSIDCSSMEITYSELKTITRQNIDALQKYADASADYVIESWLKINECIKQLIEAAREFQLPEEEDQNEEQVWIELKRIIKETFSPVGTIYEPTDEKIKDGMSLGIESPCISDKGYEQISFFLDHLLKEKERRGWEIEFADSLTRYIKYSNEPRYLFQDSHPSNLDAAEHLALLYSLEEEFAQRNFQWKDVAEAVTPLRKEVESSRRLLEGTSRDFWSQIQVQENRMEDYKTSVDKWISQKEDSIKNLERVYNEKLALAKPKEHWDSRAKQEAKNTKKWAKCTAIVTGLAVVLSTAAIVTLYSFEMPKIPFLSTSFIAIALITFMVYLVRVFVKITLSSRHLQMAYEQKSALTYFYLSLGKHEGELTEEERVLVIQSLFTPVETGLVKSSELPDFNAALALITKRVN
ncbi:DUF6161 domain-containing protein [Canibacter zhoujuaniae]|uniref:DUF6161 domain-containing protein n=1 Tax=Canibacter zhoujuaniae TaxID=2708343 RepID=UPI0014246E68|nr:DUF6161 domain-containing protein [Canibacter zhoujuaniae]